jgi:hypothetical protein
VPMTMRLIRFARAYSVIASAVALLVTVAATA